MANSRARKRKSARLESVPGGRFRQAERLGETKASEVKGVRTVSANRFQTVLAKPLRAEAGGLTVRALTVAAAAAAAAAAAGGGP